MLLGRLRVRQKLAVLVVPLLLLVVAAAVPLVAGRVSAAARSNDDARAVERAVGISALVNELQQERLQSLGYLQGEVSRDDVVPYTARVLELTAQLDRNYGRGDDQLSSVLRGVSYRAGLGGVRIQVLAKRATGILVYASFTESITGLIDLLGVAERADRTTAIGRQQLALDAIVRHDEGISGAGAALFVEPVLRVSPRVIGYVSAGLAVEDYQEDVFVGLADPTTVELYQQVATGPSSTTLLTYLNRLRNSAGAVEGSVSPELLFRVKNITSLSRLVGDRVAAQAVRQADDSAGGDRRLALLGVLVALLLLVGAAVLALFVSRSIARPLRRLTESADEVADVAQQELVRVADTDDPEAAVPQLRPVRVGTTDELGELAQAFNRVQQVAAALVERQLVSRQNVATMFGNVGRRTQNLVGRQLAMIDSLERNEQDPALLDRLYRLDHVSTRLRRNANSLVVLSGALDQQISGEPLSVADTIRSALGEIEGFQRVRLGEVDAAVLTPNVTPDVILLLAELLENGTSFSPPHTEVKVDAQAAAGGDVVIRIVDHGLGMTPEQLAAENGRLVSRERLDLAPTDVLGLFVVGRLARRHGIEVLLAPTPGTGVTAEVRVPDRHVVRTEAPAVAAGREDQARGWWEADGRSGTPSAPVSWAGAPAPQRVTETGGRAGPAPMLPTVPAPQGTPTPVDFGRSGGGRDGRSADRNGRDPGSAGRDGGSGGRDGGSGGRDGGSADRNGRDPGSAGRDGGSAGRDGVADADGRDARSADRNGHHGGNGAVRRRSDRGAAGVVRADPAGADPGAAGPVGEGPAGGIGAAGRDGGPGPVRAAGADAVRPDTRRGGATRARIRAVPDAGAGSGGSGAAAPLRALAGIVRRVRGAQLPDTGGPRRPEPVTPPPTADEARQSVVDFEAGVRRALRDTGADPAAMSTEHAEAPWSALTPADEGTTVSKALVDEFEDGVRRALARLDEVAARPAPGPAMLFERRPRAIPSPRRPASSPTPPDRPTPTDSFTPADRPAPTDPPALTVRPAPTDRPTPPAPTDRPTPPDRPAPMDRFAPMDRPAPMDRFAPMDRPAPMDRTAPPDRPAPTDRPTSTDRPTPTDSFRPTDRSAPTDRTARTDLPAAGGPEQGDELPRITPRRLDSGATLGRLGLRPTDEPERERPTPAPGSARDRAPGSGQDRAPGSGRYRHPGPAGDPAPGMDAAVRGSAAPDADRAERGRPTTPAPADGGVAPGGSADGRTEVRPLEQRRRGGEPTPDAGPGIGGSVRRIGTNGLPDRRRAVDPGPSGPEGLADLVRRVPGAQFPAGARGAVPGTPQPGPAAEQDAAAAARAFVEEFEAGVERALRDGGDRTAGTDEEDAR